MERAYDTVPRNRGKNLTLLCALTLQGPQATFMVDGGVNGLVFVTYVREVLRPCLRAGLVVVMDNLAPYSPDVSPIELMFAKVKAAMRAVAVRTRTAVVETLDWALSTVTAQDARGYFRAVHSLQLL